MLLEAGMVIGGGLLVSKYFKGKQAAESDDLGKKVADKVVKEVDPGEVLVKTPNLHAVIRNAVAATRQGKGNPYVFEAATQQMNSVGVPVELRARIIDYFRSKAPAEYDKWQIMRNDNEPVKQATFYPLVAATLMELGRPQFKR